MKPLAPLELKLPNQESSLERLVRLYFAYVSWRQRAQLPDATALPAAAPICRRADFTFCPLAQPQPAPQPARSLKPAWN
jgi:hypothetical protein